MSLFGPALMLLGCADGAGNSELRQKIVIGKRKDICPSAELKQCIMQKDGDSKRTSHCSRVLKRNEVNVLEVS